jgi:hypothetical protein
MFLCGTRHLRSAISLSLAAKAHSDPFVMHKKQIFCVAAILSIAFAPTVHAALCDRGVREGDQYARLGCSSAVCTSWCGTSWSPSNCSSPSRLHVECGCHTSSCKCVIECLDDNSFMQTRTVSSTSQAVISNCMYNVRCAMTNGVQSRRDLAVCRVLPYTNATGSSSSVSTIGIVIGVLVMVATVIGGIIFLAWWCCFRPPVSAAVVTHPHQQQQQQVAVVSSTTTTTSQPVMAYPPAHYPHPPQGVALGVLQPYHQQYPQPQPGMYPPQQQHEQPGAYPGQPQYSPVGGYPMPQQYHQSGPYPEHSQYAPVAGYPAPIGQQPPPAGYPPVYAGQPSGYPAMMSPQPTTYPGAVAEQAYSGAMPDASAQPAQSGCSV